MLYITKKTYFLFLGIITTFLFSFSIGLAQDAIPCVDVNNKPIPCDQIKNSETTVTVNPKGQTTTETNKDGNTLTPYKPLAQLPGFSAIIAQGDFTLGSYVQNLVRIAIGIIGLLAVVMIVISGVQYMGSNIITEKESAKDHLTGAVFGLILAVSSVLILRTINPNITKLSIGNFKSDPAKWCKENNVKRKEVKSIEEKIKVDTKFKDTRTEDQKKADKALVLEYDSTCFETKGVEIADELEVEVADTSPAGNSTQAAAYISGLKQAPSTTKNKYGYFKMPDAPNGEYTFWGATPPDERYASRAMIDLLYTVALEWAKRHPEEKLVIGDLNARGHVSHKYGIDVDLYTIKSTGAMGTPGSFISDEKKATELGKLFVDVGGKNSVLWMILYNQTSVQKEVNPYANQNKGKYLHPNELMFSAKSHWNHFHIRINLSYKGEYNKF